MELKFSQKWRRVESAGDHGGDYDDDSGDDYDVCFYHFMNVI